MPAWLRQAALVWLVLSASGCLHQAGSVDGRGGVWVENVPFFPQSRYQCGPAALATVLSHNDVSVTPDELVGQVYVPGRRGSFQIELKSATRSEGRIPYELEPRFGAIVEELEGGRPVLVLQNLLLDWAPRWHYAVVVGYDERRRQLVLRSGKREQHRQSLSAFSRTWRLAGNWAMVIVKPGELPAADAPSRYLKALVDSRRTLSSEAFQSALRAGLRRWPADPDLLFATGNHALQRGDDQFAAASYRRAIVADPAHVGALNNYAEVLKRNNCPGLAMAAATKALRHAEQSVLYDRVQATIQELAALQPGNPALEEAQVCDSPGLGRISF